MRLIICLLIAGSSAIACSEPTVPAVVAQITIEAQSTSLPSGSTAQLVARSLDKNGRLLLNRPITWSSSTQEIATVSQLGLVTALRNQDSESQPVEISATSGAITSILRLHVLPVPVASIHIESPQQFQVAVGDSLQLLVTVKDSAGEAIVGRAVLWTVADTTIASISASGLLVPRPYADTGLRATVVNVIVGANAASQRVDIQPAPVARVDVAGMQPRWFLNEEKTLVVTPRSRSDAPLSNRRVLITAGDSTVIRIRDRDVRGLAQGHTRIAIAVDTIHQSFDVVVDTATTYSIPVDVQQIVYPASYHRETTSHDDLPTDLCAIAQPGSRIAVPKSFLGTRPLPLLESSDQLSSNINRGMRIKDVWEVNNAAYVRGCRHLIREAYMVTLERLKALGVDYLTLAPWTFGVLTATGEVRIGNPSEMQSSTISDVDLRWAVEQAQQNGLKVHWLNQIQALCQDTFVPCVDASSRGTTTGTVATFMGAYRTFMLDRAALLNALGVDVMQVACICYFPTWFDNAIVRVYLDSLNTLVPDIKKVFDGKVRMGWNPALAEYPVLLANIDYLDHGTWSNLSPEEYDKADVDALASEFFANWECNIKRCNPRFVDQIAQIPAIFGLGAPSHAKAEGSYEETFCTTTIMLGPEDKERCVQRSVQADFALQANVIQAQLRAFRDQNVVAVHAFEFGDYWPVNKLDPTTSFPNIAYSPRNKPAEAVLRHWFRR